MSQPATTTRPDSLRSVLGAAVLLALAGLGVAAVKSHRDLAAARERERELKATIEATSGRIETLKSRIARLRDDPATLERLAREDLGLVRPHDLVIVLPAEGPLPPRPRPAPPSPPLAIAAPGPASPAATPAPLPAAAQPLPASPGPGAAAPAAAGPSAAPPPPSR